ncbi:MAG: EF-hand domain-containing protein [Xanthobacteraceae bacterium]
MSVQAASSQNAYNYLQSLLQQQTGITNGQTPLQTLLDEFYPTDASAPTSSAAPASTQANANSSSEPPGNGLSSDTFGALISLQGNDPVASKAQSIFAGLDSNGDGSVSQSEFESAFGSGADTSKVDALFNSLDANGDGSVSQSELTSAAEASHAHHHHHAHGGGGGKQGGLQELMSAISGANSQTTSNADGSSSTTITYADGSSIVLNSAPSSSSSGSGTSSSSGPGQQTMQFNLLEKLIQMQSQMINPSSSVGSSTLLSV